MLSPGLRVVRAFGSAFGDLDCISGKFAGLVVKRWLETREEQFLKHEPGLLEVGMAFDIGQTVDIGTIK